MPGRVVGDVERVGFHGDDAAVGHRVAGVDHKVEQDLFHAAAVGPDGDGLLGQMRHQFDMGADAAPEQDAGLLDDRVEVDEFRVGGFLAGKEQQLPGQVPGAFGAAADTQEIVAHVRVGDLLEGEVEIVEVDREQVVEVVRDTAGELAEALQALRTGGTLEDLLALPFGAFAGGDVTLYPGDTHHGAVLVTHR
nr:hypothetical protein GCM10020092_032740 [Actinoplanes digitatis]